MASHSVCKIDQSTITDNKLVIPYQNTIVIIGVRMKSMFGGGDWVDIYSGVISHSGESVGGRCAEDEGLC